MKRQRKQPLAPLASRRSDDLRRERADYSFSLAALREAYNRLYEPYPPAGDMGVTSAISVENQELRRVLGRLESNLWRAMKHSEGMLEQIQEELDRRTKRGRR